VKAEMAAPKKNVGYLAVTNSEYAALAASDAAGKRISSNSQYQITSEDRAIMAAGKAAAKSALARHDAWDKAWRNAPNDAARAKVEAEAEKAESGMKKYPVTRLHFARTSAKAKFAKPQFRTKKLHNGYIAVEVNQGNGWERYDTTHEESWNGIEEYERGYQKAYDQGLRYSGGAWRIPSTNASRPGSKAKFEKEYVLWGLPKGETDAIHQQVLSTQAKTPAQMEDVKKRAAAAGWHSFRVQILDLSKPYKGFARPGVKAEMASGWSGKTAKLNRYGNFAVVAAGEDGYAKGFANRTQAQAFSDKHNLGGVKFPSSGGRSFYVFVEAPKDSESTSAARPGAKAEFDLTGMELYSRIVPTINSLGRFVEVQAPRLKQNIADAAKYAKKAFDLGQQIFQSNTASPEALRAFERQVSVAKAQPGWRIASSENFSRPGVKAKFEKEYVLWGLPKGETDAIHQQVLSTQAKTPAQMEDVKKRAAAAGWHSFRVQILDLSKPYKGFARLGAKAKA